MPGISRGRPSDDAAAVELRPGEPFLISLAPEPPAVGDHVTDCRTGRRAEVTGHLPAVNGSPRLELRDTDGTHWHAPAEAVRAHAFAAGDVVRVRDESWLSVIDQPTDGPPTCGPERLAPMEVCCVPVAHVRPLGEPDGTPRWVQISDLSRADPGVEA